MVGQSGPRSWAERRDCQQGESSAPIQLARGLITGLGHMCGLCSRISQHWALFVSSWSMLTNKPETQKAMIGTPDWLTKVVPPASMWPPSDFLVGHGAVASSHPCPFLLSRFYNSVHVSPHFGAPSCFSCLAEVALPQEEVGHVGDPGWPGLGASGLPAQVGDMTRRDIYKTTINN